MRREGFAIDVNFLIAFAPPTGVTVHDAERIPDEHALALHGDVIPVHRPVPGLRENLTILPPVAVEVHRVGSPFMWARSNSYAIFNILSRKVL